MPAELTLLVCAKLRREAEAALALPGLEGVHLAGVPAVPHGDHRAVVEAPLQELRGAPRHRLPLRLGIRPPRGHDRVGEPELLPEAGFQVEVQPGWRGDPDVHHARPAGPLQQPLDLRAGEPELAPDLLLRPPVDVVAVGDPRELLEVF